MSDDTEKKKYVRCKELIFPEYRVLSFFHLWPQKTKSVNLRIVGVLSLASSFIAFGINVYCMARAAQMGLSHFGSIVHFIFIHLTALSYVVKVSVFIAKQKTLFGILDAMDDPMFNPTDEVLNSCIQEAKQQATFLRYCFYYPSSSTLGLVCALPMLVPDTVGELPFPFPMDMKTCSVPTFLFVYIYQIFFFITNGICLFALDITVCMFTFIGIVQFKILNKKLEIASAVVKEYGTNDAYAIQVLQDFVKHHYLILEYVDHCEELFSYGILAQFLSNYTGIGISGFTIVVTPLMSIVVAISVAYFVTALVEIAMVCHFGNELTYQSSIVSDSCYALPWDTYLPNTNKQIFIIMERVRRPIELTAGKFFILSYKTFLSVVQTGFSYITVLERFYNGE